MEPPFQSSVTNVPLLMVWVLVALLSLLLAGRGGDSLSEGLPCSYTFEGLVGCSLKCIALLIALARSTHLQNLLYSGVWHPRRPFLEAFSMLHHSSLSNLLCSPGGALHCRAFLEYFTIYLFWSAILSCFSAVPQCASCNMYFPCVTCHIFFCWNQQMSRWMSSHGVWMFLHGLLCSGMSFSAECYHLCVFCQFYQVLVLREATLCFQQLCAQC